MSVKCPKCGIPWSEGVTQVGHGVAGPECEYAAGLHRLLQQKDEALAKAEAEGRRVHQAADILRKAPPDGGADLDDAAVIVALVKKATETTARAQDEVERLNEIVFAYESVQAPVNPLLAENKRLLGILKMVPRWMRESAEVAQKESNDAKRQ